MSSKILFHLRLMPEFTIIDEPLPRVFLLNCPNSSDKRGDFTKYYNINSFTSLGIDFNVAESFFTRSTRDVIRGMHFQVGTSAHDKLVMCIKGVVLDVIVDVRYDSPFFNKPYSIQLSQECNNCLLLEKAMLTIFDIKSRADALFHVYCI